MDKDEAVMTIDLAQIDVSLQGPHLDAAFAVPSSGVTAVWGPSGAGKTTLLRAIAGLARLDGHVKVDGDTWQDGRTFRPVHSRRIGFVFQEPSLLPHLGVRGNLDYAAKRAGASVDFDAVVAQLKLDTLLGRGVGKLSGGERQRVALGRALLSAPKLLLMDEPLSSLDGEAKAEIVPIIADLAKTSGLPILYVSHDAYEIERLADRVLRIQDGKVSAKPEKAFSASLDGMSEAQVRALAEAALKAGIRV
jgi:molybdate transport system ATP-binding protein